jgi:hypothetical protein
MTVSTASLAEMNMLVHHNNLMCNCKTPNTTNTLNHAAVGGAGTVAGTASQAAVGLPVLCKPPTCSLADKFMNCCRYSTQSCSLWHTVMAHSHIGSGDAGRSPGRPRAATNPNASVSICVECIFQALCNACSSAGIHCYLDRWPSGTWLPM